MTDLERMILGRECEERHRQTLLAEEYSRECGKYQALLARLKSGEVSLDELEVTEQGWRVVPMARHSVQDNGQES
jgi:hypothetical protein